MTKLKFHSKAIISDCSKYRYELHREWDKKKGKVLFIMLNPSTADHVEDDLTTIMFYVDSTHPHINKLFVESKDIKKYIDV